MPLFSRPVVTASMTIPQTSKTRVVGIATLLDKYKSLPLLNQRLQPLVLALTAHFSNSCLILLHSLSFGEWSFGTEA